MVLWYCSCKKMVGILFSMCLLWICYAFVVGCVMDLVVCRMRASARIFLLVIALFKDVAIMNMC